MSNTKTFHTLLGNALIAYVTNFFIWFALVFWAFLQTNSLVVSSLIGGFFAAAQMLTAIHFGNIVDHNKKHSVILRSSIGSATAYLVGAIIYFSNDPVVFTTITSRQLRLLIVTLMSGTIIGNLRTIALSTTVSLLLPTEEHAKANGKIGTINGVGFTLTSVASGLVIGFLGMGWAIAGAAAIMLLVIGHIMTFTIPEQTIFSTHTDQEKQTLSKKLNVKETIATINKIPGLFALIGFTTFNNFLGGVFMALMDPYGLLLVPVQIRGIMFAVASLAFIAAGIYISKKGLGKNPLRTIFIVNICMRCTCIYFTIQPSVILIFSGMLIWMFCSPFAEASESTVLQKVVPYKKQGRVFGIAQSIESAAMPITALLIGPIAEFFFIPLMTDGYGAQLIGHRFGTGPGRGIAIVFMLAGIIGLIVTLIAYKSKYYKLLTKSYLTQKDRPAQIDTGTPVEVGIN